MQLGRIRSLVKSPINDVERTLKDNNEDIKIQILIQSICSAEMKLKLGNSRICWLSFKIWVGNVKMPRDGLIHIDRSARCTKKV